MWVTDPSLSESKRRTGISWHQSRKIALSLSPRLSEGKINHWLTFPIVLSYLKQALFPVYVFTWTQKKEKSWHILGRCTRRIVSEKKGTHTHYLVNKFMSGNLQHELIQQCRQNHDSCSIKYTVHVSPFSLLILTWLVYFNTWGISERENTMHCLTPN